MKTWDRYGLTAFPPVPFETLYGLMPVPFEILSFLFLKNSSENPFKLCPPRLSLEQTPWEAKTPGDFPAIQKQGLLPIKNRSSTVTKLRAIS